MSALQGTEYADPAPYYQVQQLPAEGAVPASTDREIEALQRLAQTVAQNHAYSSHTVPVTRQLNFQVAMFLQQHPRRKLTTQEIAAGTGLTSTQVSSVTQRFVAERTDVDRVKRGTVVYTPGKGPGIKPAEDDPPVTKPAAKSIAKDKTSSPRKPAVIAYAGATYTELPGCSTADGRKVVRGPGGILYALAELA